MTSEKIKKKIEKLKCEIATRESYIENLKRELNEVVLTEFFETHRIPNCTWTFKFHGSNAFLCPRRITKSYKIWNQNLINTGLGEYNPMTHNLKYPTEYGFTLITSIKSYYVNNTQRYCFRIDDVKLFVVFAKKFGIKLETNENAIYDKWFVAHHKCADETKRHSVVTLGRRLRYAKAFKLIRLLDDENWNPWNDKYNKL